jgi:cell division protein FtsI/penicillin-binding protein 2
MEFLTKLVAIAANETKLAEKTQKNATKIADLQAKASTAAVKMSNMTSNTTLTSACAAIIGYPPYKHRPIVILLILFLNLSDSAKQLTDTG